MDAGADVLALVPPRALQEYVHGYLQRFVASCSERFHQLGTSLTPYTAMQTMQDFLNTLPITQQTETVRRLQLEFKHDCLSLGCLDQQCVLCQHNPARRCTQNLSSKYLVGDIIKAKCSSPLRLELVDSSGRCCDDCVADGVKFEMFIIDGGMYDECDVDFDACAKLQNKKSEPLLIGGVSDPQGKLLLTSVRGVIQLPDAHMTDSSEALLGSGRKPYFKLVVRPVTGQSLPVSIDSAVSESFTVATRRTRTAAKVEVPSQDDHVSKLIHMGKETVKKLRNIKEAAINVGVDIDVPENTIQTVRDFQQLVSRADQDGLLRQKLQRVLMLSKEKWEEAREHAMKAVKADNRIRIWYQDPKAMDVGLMFKCRKGVVDLGAPVALVQSKPGQPTPDYIRVHHLNPGQLDIRRRLQPQAGTAWWLQGHPGWAISPWDSEVYEQTGILATVGNWKDGEELPGTLLPLPNPAYESSPELPPMSPPTNLGWGSNTQQDVLCQGPTAHLSTSQYHNYSSMGADVSSTAPGPSPNSIDIVQQQAMPVVLPAPALPPNLQPNAIPPPMYHAGPVGQYGSNYHQPSAARMPTQSANPSMPPQSLVMPTPSSSHTDQGAAASMRMEGSNYVPYRQLAGMMPRPDLYGTATTTMRTVQTQQPGPSSNDVMNRQPQYMSTVGMTSDFRNAQLAAAVLGTPEPPMSAAAPRQHYSMAQHSAGMPSLSCIPSDLPNTLGFMGVKSSFGLSMSMVEAANQALQEAEAFDNDDVDQLGDDPCILTSKELDVDSAGFLNILRGNAGANCSWEMPAGYGMQGHRSSGGSDIRQRSSGLDDMKDLEQALALNCDPSEVHDGGARYGNVLAKRTRDMRSVTSLDFR